MKMVKTVLFGVSLSLFVSSVLTLFTCLSIGCVSVLEVGGTSVEQQQPVVKTVPRKVVPQEEKLIECVVRLQSIFVKPNFTGGTVFMDADLKFFRRSDGVEQLIPEYLAGNMGFVELLGEIRVLDNGVQKRMFARVAGISKPIRKQKGVTGSQEQTVAERKARWFLAGIIVGTAKKMLTKPQAQLEAEAKRATAEFEERYMR